jgi:phosphate transport system protein
MRLVLESGDARLAERTVSADDLIDRTQLALTERCYDLLSRQQPVAGDLRLVVSVIRMAAELERVADLALRVVKHAGTDHEALTADAETYEILDTMAARAADAFREAMRTWNGDDLAGAEALVAAQAATGYLHERLLRHLVGLTHPEAARIAVRAAMAGQAIDRIADHARVMAARVAYLHSADHTHLASEVR